MKILQRIRVKFARAVYNSEKLSQKQNVRNLEKAINGEKWLPYIGLMYSVGYPVDCRDPEERKKYIELYSEKIKQNQRKINKLNSTYNFG